MPNVVPPFGRRARSSRRACHRSVDGPAVAGDDFSPRRPLPPYRPITTIVDAGGTQAAEAANRSARRRHGEAAGSRARVVEPGSVSVLEAAGLSRSSALGDAGLRRSRRAPTSRSQTMTPRDRHRRHQPKPSIWSAIHPRLLELIRAHQSTLIFVNSRRLRNARRRVETNWRARCWSARITDPSLASSACGDRRSAQSGKRCAHSVATSSLELGIDMGAIDPSFRSKRRLGRQRTPAHRRGGHQIDAVSEVPIFPRFPATLSPVPPSRRCTTVRVEATRYPRNPLDVVAQQIVAMAAENDTWAVDDDLYRVIAAPRACVELSRCVFDGVLDMLSGRYPSDEFAELRPRITWDRVATTIVAREGAKRVAIANGGTIPDRGLYGVFLIGAARCRTSRRTRRRDGLRKRTSVRRLCSAHRRGGSKRSRTTVLVSPAPGEPGKMPFWKGDRAGRPLELVSPSVS